MTTFLRNFNMVSLMRTSFPPCSILSYREIGSPVYLLSHSNVSDCFHLHCAAKKHSFQFFIVIRWWTYSSSVTRFFFLRAPNQCCQIAKSRPSWKLLRNLQCAFFPKIFQKKAHIWKCFCQCGDYQVLVIVILLNCIVIVLTGGADCTFQEPWNLT